MPNDKYPTQHELSEKVMAMKEVHGPNRQVIISIGYQIQSNGRLEDAINNFHGSTNRTEKHMRNLAKAQVKLAYAQIMLAIAAILVTLL